MHSTETVEDKAQASVNNQPTTTKTGRDIQSEQGPKGYNGVSASTCSQSGREVDVGTQGNCLPTVMLPFGG